MAARHVIYLGKSSAIDANDLETFTGAEVDELLELLRGSPRLGEKVRRARDWESPTVYEGMEEPASDLRDLIHEALSEPTLGPASDRDAAEYWANLARKLSRTLQEKGLCEPRTFRMFIDPRGTR